MRATEAGLSSQVLAFAIEMQRQLDTEELHRTLSKAVPTVLLTRARRHVDMLNLKLDNIEPTNAFRWSVDEHAAQAACCLMMIAYKRGAGSEV